MPVRIGQRITAGEADRLRDATGEVRTAGVDPRVQDRHARGPRDRLLRVRAIPRDLRQGPLLQIERIVHDVAGLAHGRRRADAMDRRAPREGVERLGGARGGDGHEMDVDLGELTDG